MRERAEVRDEFDNPPSSDQTVSTCSIREVDVSIQHNDGEDIKQELTR